MFLKNHARCLALSLLMLPALALAEQKTIKVHVYGVQPASGTLEISLFNSTENFMKEPYLQESLPVSEEGLVEVEFANLTDGEYAVVVVHDANDNGALDRGFLGIGGEGYGFSNAAMPWFGWPGFEDASFTVEGPETIVEITLD
jgi:uncharacterized protein (DUF2141 family)